MSNLPTGLFLKKLSHAVDQIIIKEGGMSNGHAQSEKVVLHIDEPDHVTECLQLLAVEPPGTPVMCGCGGQFVIELHRGRVRQTTLAIHHGNALFHEGWNSLAELVDPMKLANFLRSRGLPEVLHLLQGEDAHLKSPRYFWIKHSPLLLRQYLIDSVSGLEPDISELWKRFHLGYSDEESLILDLLYSYGTTANMWQTAPSIEDISLKLLDKIDTEKILAVWMNSRRNLIAGLGLGRYLLAHNFRRRWLKKRHSISEEVLQEVANIFHQMENDEGLSRIETMRKMQRKLVR